MQNQADMIERCLNGDKVALEMLVRSLQRQTYNLAVRFLWNPMDAEDATQEIIIKLITNLATFKGQSAFETWAYRVAANHLLNLTKRPVEALTFDEGAYHLQKGLTYPAYEQPDKALLATEVKIACSTSMLIALSRPLRLTYILGEILEFNSREGAEILDVTPATFRKRLSLARGKVRRFMGQQCGLYDSNNPCRCDKQIVYDVEIGRINPNRLFFANRGMTPTQGVADIERLQADVAIFRSHPDYDPPETVLNKIRQLIDSIRYPILGDLN